MLNLEQTLHRVLFAQKSQETKKGILIGGETWRR